MATTVHRISPQQVHARLESDANTLLVCAYDSAEKFDQNQTSSSTVLARPQPRLPVGQKSFKAKDFTMPRLWRVE